MTCTAFAADGAAMPGVEVTVRWRIAGTAELDRVTTDWGGRAGVSRRLPATAAAGEEVLVSVTADYFGQVRTRDVRAVLRPAV